MLTVIVMAPILTEDGEQFHTKYLNKVNTSNFIDFETQCLIQHREIVTRSVKIDQNAICLL